MAWPAAPGWQPPVQPRTGGGVGAILATVLVGLFAVALTVGGQGVVWLVDQVLQAVDTPFPRWGWPLAAIGNALLVALPAALLSRIPRSPAVRAAGRAWLAAAAALAVLGLARFVPPIHHEAYLAVLSALALAAVFGLRRLAIAPAGTSEPAGTTPDAATAPGAGTTAGTGTAGGAVGAATSAADAGPASRRSGIALALAGGLLVLMPWLWVGALGGPTETVLAVLAALGTGWLATEVLGERFWTPYQTGGAARRVLLGGLVAGVALVLVGAGVGAAGPHLALLFLLPPLGFAAGALRAVGGRAASLAVIVPAALGPLAMVDPDEVTLLLYGRDVPLWTFVATAASIGLALLVGLAHGLLARPSLHRATAAFAAGLSVIAAGAVYVGLGQPGLHGDRLFVVMRDQPSLAGLPTPTGPGSHGSRVRAVYERLVGHAERSQAGLRRELDKLHLSYTPYYLVNALEVDGGPVVREWLSRRDDVDRVLLSQRLRPLPAAPSTSHGSAAAPRGPQWNITMIGADRAWSELNATGVGVVVGTSDSGVDLGHLALRDGFRGGGDSWYDPWNRSRVPQDHGGHGTHTLGTAVGRNGIGVAPDAQWMGCVNLDRNMGSPARYLDCLQFMLAPFPYGGDPFADGRPDRAPNVLTNSWGCPRLEGCDRGVLRPATAAFAAAGIFFVAAAGNTGPRCDSIDDPPAPYEDVLTVGAVNRGRRVTGFSSRGPTDDGRAKPDVVAPGEGVLSAMPGGGYAAEDGTSMAAPHVAGVVALMWSANPNLVGDIARTRQLLRDTAAPVALAGQNDCGGAGRVSGAGMVDAYSAVLAARGKA